MTNNLKVLRKGNIAIYYVRNGENEPIFSIYDTPLPRHTHSFPNIWQMASKMEFSLTTIDRLYISDEVKLSKKEGSAYFDYRTMHAT